MLYLKIVNIDCKLFVVWFKAEPKFISCANYLGYILKLNLFIDLESKFFGVRIESKHIFSTNYLEHRLKLNPFVDLACRLYLYCKLNPVIALFMRMGVNRSLLPLQGVTNRNEGNKVDCYVASGKEARDEEQDYSCCT
jgi:hypothetical protein